MARSGSSMTSSYLIQVGPTALTEINFVLTVSIYRKTNVVPAEGGQDEAAAAENGPLQLSLERQPNNHLRWLERLPGPLGRDIHRPEKGRRQAKFQHTQHNQR